MCKPSAWYSLSPFSCVQSSLCQWRHLHCSLCLYLCWGLDWWNMPARWIWKINGQIKGVINNYLIIAVAICDPPCTNGGHCIAPNMCNCGSGFTNTQSGCTGNNHLIIKLWAMHGTILLYWMCVNAVRCTNRCINGRCVGLNQCECEDGWQGDTCNERKPVATETYNHNKILSTIM